MGVLENNKVRNSTLDASTGNSWWQRSALTSKSLYDDAHTAACYVFKIIQIVWLAMWQTFLSLVDCTAERRGGQEQKGSAALGAEVHTAAKQAEGCTGRC